MELIGDVRGVVCAPRLLEDDSEVSIQQHCCSEWWTSVAQYSCVDAYRRVLAHFGWFAGSQVLLT